jgi:hypothetical protein
MDSRQIAIFVAVFVVVGFRLYKKYGQKKTTDTGIQQDKSSFPKGHDDEYEPYSKK